MQDSPDKPPRDRWKLFVDRRTPDVSRRSFLRAGGLGAGLGTIGAIARGWYPFGWGLPGHIQPAGKPLAIPASLDDGCESEQESHTRVAHPSDAIYWGTYPGDGRPVFELRVEEPRYARGDTIDITLRNGSPWPKEVGQFSVRHNLEVLTKAGWQDLRLVEGDDGRFPQVTTNPAFPGRVHEWSFPLTEAGIVDLHAMSSSMEVCPGLPVGRYRFVCGAVGSWDDGVAVAFDVPE